MKALSCKYCRGEVEIVGNERAVNKKVRCLKCGFTNAGATDKKEPEVLVIRKRPS